jgi:hypothetical protein
VETKSRNGNTNLGSGRVPLRFALSLRESDRLTIGGAPMINK